MSRVLGFALFALTSVGAFAIVGPACSSFGDSSTTDFDAAAEAAAAADAGDAAAAAEAGDAAEAAAEHVVHCGSTTANCILPSQTCCYVGSGGYDCKSATACTCIPAGMCTDFELPCDDDTDCKSGLFCCGVLKATKDAVNSIGCVAPSSCQATLSVHLCDLANPQPTCPTGKVCMPFTKLSLPGVGHCE